MEYNVAIIGAGPAGSSCACALLGQGCERIALIDKAEFPRDKSCGDGLGPGVVHELHNLGLAYILEKHQAIELFSISSPSGTQASGPLPMINGQVPIGYVIPRLIFDNAIAQAALERGAANFTGWNLKDARFDKNQKIWEIDLQHSNSKEERRITARALVGADGASSKVRRILGAPSNSDRQKGTAVRIYAKSKSRKRLDLRLDFLGPLLPAYGWVFPINETTANIGVGIDLENYKKGHYHLKELLTLYQTQLNCDYEYDNNSYLSYILPYAGSPKSPTMIKLGYWDEQAALIGDAGSMINPLTGEGIYYGIFAGRLLAEKLSAMLKGSISSLSAFADYDIEFKKRFNSHFSTNWMMKEKVAIPILCDMVVRACNRDKQVLIDLINLMMGDQKFVKNSTKLRILCRNLFPF